MLKAEEQCVLWWEFYFSIRVFSYRFRKEYSLKDISNHLTFEQSPNCEIYYLEINTRSILSWKILINSFLANILFLYPLKTPENPWFTGAFKGWKVVTLATNGLRRDFPSLESSHFYSTWWEHWPYMGDSHSVN